MSVAAEALDPHLRRMAEGRAPIPALSGLDAAMPDPARAVRVNVPLPENLVQAIDRRTANRSRFLAEAGAAKLREGPWPGDPGASEPA